MKAIWYILALAAGTLAFLWVDVAYLRDRQTFVPPADSVAESFMQKLATRRFSAALSHLSSERQGVTSVGDLRSYARNIERKTGGIKHVDQERSELDGEKATAWVKVTTKSGSERSLEFKLKRENGEWKIDELPEL